MVVVVSSWLDAALVTWAVIHLLAVLLVAGDLVYGWDRRGVLDCTACCVAGAIAAIACGFDPVPVVAAALACSSVTVVAATRAVDLTGAGIVAWATLVGLNANLLVQAFVRLVSADLGAVAGVLLWVVAVLAVLRIVPNMVLAFENWEPGFRRRWRADGASPAEPVDSATAPKVTVQVPIHAEPPEVVIATLDALSRLQYPDFEVMVIDNNTSREELWLPVREHCRQLGGRFRFLRVTGITGAKAGALNWARPRLSPDTELVALVDADYQVDPAWLRDAVGFFADPEVGFVQCPHAYRGFEHSTYGRMANAAYAWAQRTEMVSRHEQGAGITIGTMSLIRLRALDDAGGWAEWCLTEDSEFAIRVHAAGYRSVFLQRAYGWGLIPETFAELRKQRYRWSYGPGQEARRHWRLFVPGPLRTPSRLTGRQRFRHANYGLVMLAIGLGALSLPISAALLVLMALQHQVPQVGAAVVIAAGAALLARRVMRWSTYRKVVGMAPREALGGLIALVAMRPTMAKAGLDVLLGRRAAWERTDKFTQRPERYRVVRTCAREIVVGTACVAAAVAAPLVLPPATFTVMLSGGFAWQAFVHATGPLLAFLAERDLRRRSVAADVPTVRGPTVLGKAGS